MKNSIKIFIAVLCVFGIYSCNKPPKDAFIKDSIKNRYSMMGLAAGAGSWDVHQINILSINKTKNLKEWEIKAEVSGYYENLSLPEGTQDKHNFKDTVKLIFIKKSMNEWQYRDY